MTSEAEISNNMPMAIDKSHFINALRAHYQEQLEIARRASAEAADAAQTFATESEKKEDSRAMLEFSSVAKGHILRAQGARDALAQIDHFEKQPQAKFSRKTPIALGAMVDVQMETDEGSEERTFYLLPLGAGTELNGPGGDGFVSVITPQSPIGKQLLGKRVGESFDMTVRGDAYEWHVLDVL